MDPAAADVRAGRRDAGRRSLLLYFTSGTTARPKLVEHTHASYPVGHLSTMYWLGLQPGDVHLNISSPGWAKHAWSNVFAPWNAAATVVIFNQPRFDAGAAAGPITRCDVTTFCAPPTVWRMLIQTDLASSQTKLREVVGAGEPLNPEVIEQVRPRLGSDDPRRLRPDRDDRAGRQPARPANQARLDGPAVARLRVVLLDPMTGEPADEGEIALDLSPRPLGLMAGYRGDAERTAEVMRGGYYHTGDIAVRDADGYITYVGRTDDVFKASDYRISPFELESVLIEHAAVAEAAVVPRPIRCGWRCPRPMWCWRPATSPTGTPRWRSCGSPGAPGPVQTDPATGVRRATQDDLGEDPPG